MRLAVRRRISGSREGDRLTRGARGTGEFHSHRAYASGDDLRQIDWNVYARLGSLFVRQQTHEAAPTVQVFVDTSASMGFGKLEAAVQVAGALGAIALDEHARLMVQGEGPFPGVPELLQGLSNLTASGRCDLAGRIRAMRGGGVLSYFLSDFWDDELRSTVLHARSQGEVGLIQILSAGEMEPPEDGRVRWIDSESGEECIRQVGAEERESYRRLLEEHLAECRRWATDHEISHLRCRADTPFEQIVFVLLQEAGMVQ